jgi:hypothetical protein
MAHSQAASAPPTHLLKIYVLDPIPEAAIHISTCPQGGFDDL